MTSLGQLPMFAPGPVPLHVIVASLDPMSAVAAVTAVCWLVDTATGAGYTRPVVDVRTPAGVL